MRCFIAVDVPEELKPGIIELQEQISRFDIRLVEPENLHFTLKFLGELESPEIVSKSLDFIRRLEHFKISLKGTGIFPPEGASRVVWIGTEHSQSFINLQKSIDDALYPGFMKEEFIPHLTIARVRSHEPGITGFAREKQGIEMGKMDVNCVKLKKSMLSGKGPVYSDIEKFEMI